MLAEGRRSTSFPPTRASRDASQGTCNCQKPGLGTCDHDDDKDDDDDGDDVDTDDDDDSLCFLAYDELGMCRVSLASHEQPVLCIPVRSADTRDVG